MILFDSDYQEIADTAVLEAFGASAHLQLPGYGDDSLTPQVQEMIRTLCQAPDAGVHFFVGGTQINLTVIAAALKPFEGVLCPDIGHINVHETGAIEATGHKVLALKSTDGKITAEQIQAAFDAHVNDATHEHMVRPGMIYLSHPTELGTLYTRKELSAIHTVAEACGLRLYIDGARLAYGIAAEETVDLPFLAGICDAFSIGGTKCGAMFGEALVLKNAAEWPHFRYHIKQRGALLAKGWLLAVQFQALLADNRYVQLGKEANAGAQRIKEAFMQRGFPLLCDTRANLVFPILPNDVLESLEKDFSFAFWTAVDSTHSAVRVCVSATTPGENVTTLLRTVATL